MIETKYFQPWLNISRVKKIKIYSEILYTFAIVAHTTNVYKISGCHFMLDFDDFITLLHY